MALTKRNKMTIAGFPVELWRSVFRMSETVTLGGSALAFRMPFGMELVEIPRIYLWTPQGSGDILTVDINQTPLAGIKASILSTPITIDNGEDWSVTAATPGVVSEGTLEDGALIEIDVDQVGDGTAQGMDVTFIGYRT